MKKIFDKVSRGALNFVSYMIMSITLLSAYGGIINPNDTIIPSLVVMIFPIMVIVTVIMIVIDWILRRHASVAMLIISLLISYQPIFETFPINFNGKSKAEKLPADRTFKVISYNVCNFDDLTHDEHDVTQSCNPAISYLIASKADVVCLQECVSLVASRKRTLMTEQMDSLKEIYPYQHVGDNMLTVLSRTPIEIVDMPVTPEFTFSASCYRIKIEEHEVAFINLHLQSIGLDTEDKELYQEITKGDAGRRDLNNIRRNIIGKLSEAFRKRANESDEVRRFINSLQGNVIVCGDFNDVPGCYAVRTIQGRDFRNAYTDGAFGPCWTYNSDRFLFRIDHILYRGDMKAVCTVRDDNKGSDHYPLMTTFEWTEGAR